MTPQTYRVTLSDGRAFDVTTEGGPPSEQDVLSGLNIAPPEADFKTDNAVDEQGQNVVAEAVHPHARVGNALVNAAKGVGAGAMSTVLHGGDLIRRGLGMERVIETPEAQAMMKPPEGMAGKVGFYVEQAAEFGVPLARIARVTKGLPILKRMGVEAATSAGVAGIQSGGDSDSMGVSAALGGALPVAGKAAGAVGGAVKRAAAGAQEGGLGGAVASAVRNVVPTDTRAMLVQGLKPSARNTGFEAALGRAVPELKVTEEALGKPIEGIDDLLKATNLAKKRVRAQYDELAGPRRAMGSTVDLTPVADQMIGSIPRKVRLEDPRKAAAIIERAEQYRGAFGLEEAEQLLKETNAELDSFYNKYPMAQRRALAADPEAAQLEAQARALRDVIYKTLDDEGQGAAARELNRRYGALLEIEETATRRANVAKRQQPESLNEQISGARAAGEIAKGVFKMTRGAMSGDGGAVISGGADIAGGQASRASAKFMKEQQTTDALIKRAFAAARSRPTPVEVAPKRPIRGLLGKGSVQTPPPADASYVRGVRGEYARPERKALPPARTVREAGPAPDTSYVKGGEPARNVQRDPKTGRMMRVYTGERR